MSKEKQPESSGDPGNERVLQVREFVVEPGQNLERIDRWITRRVAGATRNKVQEAIDAGAVTVNDQPTKSNYRVRPGDHIVLSVMKPPPIELVPEEIPLEILYEDEQVLVVNKPAGMVTHPGYGNRSGTLVNAVLHHVGELPSSASEADEDDDSDDIDEIELGDSPFDYDAVRPGVVHRLDKETSGVMVVAKTMRAKQVLGQQFHDREISREYRAVAWGRFREPEGTIEGNIARDPRDRKRFAVVKRGGKHAITHYHVLEEFEIATFLTFRLETGRTHQIRVHAANIGHPLIGDPTYGGDSARVAGRRGKAGSQRVLSMIDRQALHAATLGFRHPTTEKFLSFEAPIPDDIEGLLRQLRMQS